MHTELTKIYYNINKTS